MNNASIIRNVIMAIAGCIGVAGLVFAFGWGDEKVDDPDALEQAIEQLRGQDDWTSPPLLTQSPEVACDETCLQGINQIVSMDNSEMLQKITEQPSQYPVLESQEAWWIFPLRWTIAVMLVLGGGAMVVSAVNRRSGPA